MNDPTIPAGPTGEWWQDKVTAADVAPDSGIYRCQGCHASVGHPHMRFCGQGRPAA